MGSPIFTHFFGRSRRGGHALVVSLARLTPAFYGLPADRALTLRRATFEIVHELGHVAGLGHCADPRCLMHFAPTVDGIDNRGTTFCGDCAAALSAVFGSCAGACAGPIP
jgi:archaemetzincin